MPKIQKIRCLSRGWEKRLKKAYKAKVRQSGRKECKNGLQVK